MKNENKTKEQLISELIELRQRIVKLEESLKFTNKQFRDFRKTATETEKELGKCQHGTVDKLIRGLRGSKENIFRRS